MENKKLGLCVDKIKMHISHMAHDKSVKHCDCIDHNNHTDMNMDAVGKCLKCSLIYYMNVAISSEKDIKEPIVQISPKHCTHDSTTLSIKKGVETTVCDDCGLLLVHRPL